MTALLREWARSRLASGSWQDTLTAATGVSILFLSIACIPGVNSAYSSHFQGFRSIESCASNSRWLAMCQTQSPVSTKCVVNWHRKWTASKQVGLEVSNHVTSRRRLHDYLLLDFGSRCCDKLQDLGDCSMKARQYDEAISQYTIALALNPTTPQDLLGERSKAHAGNGKWEDALNDANTVALFHLL